MIYAQLDNNNVCIGISQLSGEVQMENMLQIKSYDVTILGKKYEDGKWIEVFKPPVEPTEEELIIAQNLINQATIKEQLNAIDETNSQILLRLSGGN